MSRSAPGANPIQLSAHCPVGDPMSHVGAVTWYRKRRLLNILISGAMCLSEVVLPDEKTPMANSETFHTLGVNFNLRNFLASKTDSH